MERRQNKSMNKGTITPETESLLLRRFKEIYVESVYKNWGESKRAI